MTDRKRLAPIALFVYNRPDHTRQTLQALAKNALAAQSDLIIFSDGARTDQQAEKVGEVRSLIAKASGFRSVRVELRPVNYGLARSIIGGVTEVITEYKRIIVMEDDLVTSPHFLTFMNESLEAYSDVEKVMHVSGSIFPVPNPETLPPLFFYRATSCWGWGTWERAWKTFENNPEKLIEEIETQNLTYPFDIDGTYPYTKMLRNQADGRINSWAIRWYASVFLQRGLCLHPAYSLVNNIGHDGSGMHCIISDMFQADLQKGNFSTPHTVSDLSESQAAVQQIRAFFKSQKKPLLNRIWSRMKRIKQARFA